MSQVNVNTGQEPLKVTGLSAEPGAPRGDWAYEQKPEQQHARHQGPSSFWRAGLAFLWRGSEIERLSRLAKASDEPARVRYRDRARRVAELAESNLLRWRLPGAPANWVAVGMYREAVHWALLALAGRAQALPELLDSTLPELEKDLGAQAEAIRAQLSQQSYLQTAELSTPVLEEHIVLLRAAFRAALRRSELHRHDYRRALRERALRVTLLVVGVVVFCMAGGFGLRALLEPRDLAAGKSWRASSAYDGFIYDSHVCDGLPTKILFHTQEDAEPWFEVDLGESKSFSSIEVWNREVYQARAIPLVLEVSDDRVSYREVAVQEQPFDKWLAQFPPTKARFVRARVPRLTWLHLQGIIVR